MLTRGIDGIIPHVQAAMGCFMTAVLPMVKLKALVGSFALVAVLSVGVACAQENPSPAGSSDRATLMALHNATDGSNWANNTNWLSDRPLGEWHGITTDANGRVTELNLPDNWLSGSIPPRLGGLSHLLVINLGNDFGSCDSSGCEPSSATANRLSGEMPSELGNLSNLQSLNLNYNQLSGGIPSQLGDLPNLRSLDLYGNPLGGTIPSQLGDLANLRELDLGYSQLTGSIPSELGGLTILERLELSGNQLSGEVPPELGNLVNLQRLDLSGNQLSGGMSPELVPGQSRNCMDRGDGVWSGRPGC